MFTVKSSAIHCKTIVTATTYNSEYCSSTVYNRINLFIVCDTLVNWGPF